MKSYCLRILNNSVLISICYNCPIYIPAGSRSSNKGLLALLSSFLSSREKKQLSFYSICSRASFLTLSSARALCREFFFFFSCRKTHVLFSLGEMMKSSVWKQFSRSSAGVSCVIFRANYFVFLISVFIFDSCFRLIKFDFFLSCLIFS